MQYVVRAAPASHLDFGAALRREVCTVISNRNEFRYSRSRPSASAHGASGSIGEPVRRRNRGGFDFDKLKAARERLGIKKIPPAEAEAWIADFEDEAFSLEVLGLDKEETE